jgi:hypothetical protein
MKKISDKLKTFEKVEFGSVLLVLPHHSKQFVKNGKVGGWNSDQTIIIMFQAMGLISDVLLWMIMAA